jgi:hypothetical protein
LDCGDTHTCGHCGPGSCIVLLIIYCIPWDVCIVCSYRCLVKIAFLAPFTTLPQLCMYELLGRNGSHCCTHCWRCCCYYFCPAVRCYLRRFVTAWRILLCKRYYTRLLFCWTRLLRLLVGRRCWFAPLQHSHTSAGYRYGGVVVVVCGLGRLTSQLLTLLPHCGPPSSSCTHTWLLLVYTFYIHTFSVVTFVD